jgi:lycopene beta-cyclase
MDMGADTTCDIAIVGGGLAGGLVAYALSVKRPDLSVRLVDPAPKFGGNHVWSFFTTDIAPENYWIVAPFIDHSWDGYQIDFPAFHRHFTNTYNSVRSQHYDERLRTFLPQVTPMQAEAVDLSQTSVTLSDQSKIIARGVIDARGVGDLTKLEFGWQKFIGQELRTSRPHGLTHPIVMDATVEQIDGYRFVYVLPFSKDRIFIEDTYYSDGPEIDRASFVARIGDYARAKGWDIAEIIHEEIGALPVTTGGNFEAYWQSGGAAAKIGVRAGLFHPTTGFSMPDAVRVAARIAELGDLSGAAIQAAMHDHATKAWEQGSFYRLLDRMLFHAADPHMRYTVLQRFYSLHPDLISRFYARATTLFDKARILTGRPPVPIGRALAVLRERKT